MKKQIQRFRTFIETSPWEQFLEQDGKRLRRFCWSVLGVAAIYFGSVMLHVLLRGPMK